MDFDLLLIILLIVFGVDMIGWRVRKLLLLGIAVSMVGCAGTPHLVIGTAGFMNRYMVADHQRMRDGAARQNVAEQKEKKKSAGIKEQEE